MITKTQAYAGQSDQVFPNDLIEFQAANVLQRALNDSLQNWVSKGDRAFNGTIIVSPLWPGDATSKQPRADLLLIARFTPPLRLTPKAPPAERDAGNLTLIDSLFVPIQVRRTLGFEGHGRNLRIANDSYTLAQYRAFLSADIAKSLNSVHLSAINAITLQWFPDLPWRAMPADCPVPALWGLTPAFGRITEAIIKAAGAPSTGLIDSLGDIIDLDNLARRFTQPAALSNQEQRILEKIAFDIDIPKLREAIGKKQIILKGPAGTGKTIQLLRTAIAPLRRPLHQGALAPKVAFLTYNHALLSSIRRTFQVLGLPGYGRDAGIEPKSLEAHFVALFYATGLLAEGERLEANLDDARYGTRYSALLSQLADKITAMPMWEITTLLQESKQHLAFTDICIDEAQDCDPREKEILWKIYDPKHVAVAVADDQQIRMDSPCKWDRGLRGQIDAETVPFDRSLRMKTRIAAFINDCAETFQIKDSWTVNPIEDEDDFVGGEIFLLTQPYSSYPNLHQRLTSENQRDGRTNFDILFCDTDHYEDDQGGIHASLGRWLTNNGATVWDMFNIETRRTQPPLTPATLLNYRLVPYTSCRGLEGWTAVLINADRWYDRDGNVQQGGATAVPLAGARFLLAASRATERLVICCDPSSALYSRLEPLLMKHQITTLDVDITAEDEDSAFNVE